MSDVYVKNCGTCARSFSGANDILAHGKRIRVCSSDHLWFNCQCDSTLFIPKGKFNWFTVESQLSEQAKALYQKNKSLEGIPKINSSIMKLQETIEDPKSSFTDMQRQLERSPALAILTLAMASNVNPQGTEVNDLKHAISLLGRKTLSSLALSASLVNIPLQSKLYQIQDYWQEALTSGSIARELFKKMGHNYSEELADRAYIGGCFAQIGKLIGAMSFPDQTDQIFNIVSNPKSMTTWNNAVRLINAPSLSALGEIAAASWGLPSYIKHIVVQFSNILKDMAPPGQLSILETTQFANVIYHWLNSSPHLIETDKLKHFQTHLNLDDPGMESLVEVVSPCKSKTEKVMLRLF